MYNPTLTQALTSSLAISTTTPMPTPANSNLTATLLLGPSQDCILNPQKYSAECYDWSLAIVAANLTSEVESLRLSGIFSFLPTHDNNINAATFDNINTTDPSKRNAYDNLWNPHWRDGRLNSEVACQCCDRAKSASCCAFNALSEENEKCCKREGPRCAYPAEMGGKHTIFCTCWGFEDCVMKGMWNPRVNPACRCDVTCNVG